MSLFKHNFFFTLLSTYKRWHREQLIWEWDLPMEHKTVTASSGQSQ